MRADPVRFPVSMRCRRTAFPIAGGAGGGAEPALNLQRAQPDHPIRGRVVGTVGAKCAAGARCAVFQKAQPVRPEDANKLNELINPLEAATNALSAGAAWANVGGFVLVDARDGTPMFGTLRIGDKATVYWRECGEVLSHFVVRDDGLSALALLHARQPQTVAPDVTQYPHAGILPARVWEPSLPARGELASNAVLRAPLAQTLAAIVELFMVAPTGCRCSSALDYLGTRGVYS